MTLLVPQADGQQQQQPPPPQQQQQQQQHKPKDGPPSDKKVPVTIKPDTPASLIYAKLLSGAKLGDIAIEPDSITTWGELVSIYYASLNLEEGLDAMEPKRPDHYPCLFHKYITKGCGKRSDGKCGVCKKENSWRDAPVSMLRKLKSACVLSLAATFGDAVT